MDHCYELNSWDFIWMSHVWRINSKLEDGGFIIYFSSVHFFIDAYYHSCFDQSAVSHDILCQGSQWLVHLSFKFVTSKIRTKLTIFFITSIHSVTIRRFCSFFHSISAQNLTLCILILKCN